MRALQNAPANEPRRVFGGRAKLRRKTHQTIKRISDSLESLQFNTPVAALMELSNALGDFKVEPEAAPDGEYLP